MYDKSQLRKKYMAMRDSLTAEEIKRKSFDICNTIINLDKFQKAGSIFLYINMKSEVSTSRIIKNAWENNIITYAPKVISKRVMKFFPFDQKSNLIKSRFGVFEPEYNENGFPDDDSVIIVPGLVFDKEKYRVGYGGGYYDSFLKEAKGLKIGVCYSFQIIDSFERGKYDVPVDIIVTENGIIT